MPREGGARAARGRKGRGGPAVSRGAAAALCLSQGGGRARPSGRVAGGGESASAAPPPPAARRGAEPGMGRHGKGDACRTYNAAALQELLEDSDEGPGASPGLGPGLGGGTGALQGAAALAHASWHASLSKSPGGSGWALASSPAGKARGLLSKVRERNTLQQKHVEIQDRARKVLERRMEEKAAKRDREFNEMFGRVIAGIDKEEGIMKDVDETLRVSETARAKKKAALYESWKREVYDKISSQIDDAVNRLDPHDVKRRLQTQYEAFLNASNHKAGIFRDIVIETDYDPFAHSSSLVKVDLAGIKDPVKRDLQRHQEEQRWLSKERGPAPGRRWDEEKSIKSIEEQQLATQRSIRLEGIESKEYQKRSDSRRLVFKHYGEAMQNDGGAAARLEVPKGKACRGPPGMEGKRKDLFSLMSMADSLKAHSEIIADGQTQGDTWLEHKGKGFVEKPKNPQGRKDLFAIMGHEAVYSQETQVDELGARMGRRTFADKSQGQISLAHGGESSGAGAC